MTRRNNPKAPLGDWGPWEENEMEFVMRQRIKSDVARAQMAKDYLAGGSCTEIARHYGVSASYVINVAKRWDIEQKLRRLATLEKQARQVVVAPPMETPEPGSQYVPIIYNGRPIIRMTRTVSINASERETMISLPYYQIQGEGR